MKDTVSSLQSEKLLVQVYSIAYDFIVEMIQKDQCINKSIKFTSPNLLTDHPEDRTNKLLSIVYNKGNYYICKPGN